MDIVYVVGEQFERFRLVFRKTDTAVVLAMSSAIAPWSLVPSSKLSMSDFTEVRLQSVGFRYFHGR